MTAPLKTLPLENGLTLELYDQSRPIAGDRWLVFLLARMEVPLDAVTEEEPLLSALRRVHGDQLEYRAELKKHFVDKQDKDRVLASLADIVLQEKRPYLAHPDFPRRFALARIAELRKKDPRIVE
jgi:hypothetical protein